MSSPLPPLAELKEAARAAWPERRLKRFRIHDEGWANLVLEADECVIFRIPRRREVAKSLRFELRALELLSQKLSTPIPTPIRVSVLRRPLSWSFMAYPKLPGVPLSEVGPIDSTGKRRLGEFIRTLLTELNCVPPRSLLRIGAKPGAPRDWEKRYRQLQSTFCRVTDPTVPPQARREVSEAFGRFNGALRRARYRAVASHMDLGPYNILWDRMSNRPTGVIDWEDLRLGDPAFDIAGLAGLGRSRLRALTQTRRSPRDPTFAQRLQFYRRIAPLHDFVSAAEIGNVRMARKCAAYVNANFSR